MKFKKNQEFQSNTIYTRTYIQFSILLHQYYSPKSDHFSQENKISLPLQGTEDTFPLRILESPNSRSPPSLRIKKKGGNEGAGCQRQRRVDSTEGKVWWKVEAGSLRRTAIFSAWLNWIGSLLAIFVCVALRQAFVFPVTNKNLSLHLSLLLHLQSSLPSTRWMQVCSIVGTSDTPTGGVTIPFHWLLSMRPTDTVPWTDATAARGRICITFVLLAAASSGPLTIFEFYSLNPQLLPFPFDSMIFPKIHREFTLFSLNVFFFFSRIWRECNCFMYTGRVRGRERNWNYYLVYKEFIGIGIYFSKSNLEWRKLEG